MPSRSGDEPATPPAHSATATRPTESAVPRQRDRPPHLLAEPAPRSSDSPATDAAARCDSARRTHGSSSRDASHRQSAKLCASPGMASWWKRPRIVDEGIELPLQNGGIRLVRAKTAQNAAHSARRKPLLTPSWRPWLMLGRSATASGPSHGEKSDAVDGLSPNTARIFVWPRTRGVASAHGVRAVGLPA
jgi:hypothetical protein